MTIKQSSYLVLLLLIVVGVVYIKTAIDQNGGSISDIGAGFFPIILGSLLIILCVVSFIQNALKTNDKKLDLPNLPLILITIGISALFIISWNWFGYFYISLVVYLLALMTVFYKEELRNKSRLLKNILLSLFITGLIYFVFDYLLGLRLT
nr:tripartite tricarboxylate transporter TctB family protein [Fredinandcohnia onubensis]